MELKPSDLGEIQTTRKGSFLMKCRLLRIFDFFFLQIYIQVFPLMSQTQRLILILKSKELMNTFLKKEECNFKLYSYFIGLRKLKCFWRIPSKTIFITADSWTSYQIIGEMSSFFSHLTLVTSCTICPFFVAIHCTWQSICMKV